MTDLGLDPAPLEGSVAGRAGWTLVSQGLSSLGNVILVVLAARALTVGRFGELSVALAAYSIGLGVSRALLSDPLMVRSSAADPAVARRAAAAALTAALVVAGTVGVVLLLLWRIGAPGVTAPLGLLGATLPLLLGQDLLRHVAFVVGRPAVAAVMDLTWLVGAVAGLLLLTATAPPAAYVAVWGAGAGAAALLGAAVLRLVPGRGARAQLRSARGLSAGAAAEFLCLAAASQGVILVVAALGEPELAGTLRAAGVLLGPVGVLGNGAHAVIVAEGSRSRTAGLARLRTVAMAVPLGLAAVMAGWAVALSSLPDRVGRSLLGDSWAATDLVLVRYGLVYAGLTAATELGAVLRALDQLGRAVRAAAPTLVASLAVALVFTGRGARPLTSALVVAAWLGVVLYGWQVRRAFRVPTASPPAAGAGPRALAPS